MSHVYSSILQGEAAPRCTSETTRRLRGLLALSGVRLHHRWRRHTCYRADPPPLSSASGTNDLPQHPFLVLRDRFSEAGLGEASATLDTVTSYVCAQMDDRTQVCSLRTPPLFFNFVLRCYRAYDVRGVPYRAHWRHAYPRVNVHVDGPTSTTP